MKKSPILLSFFLLPLIGIAQPKIPVAVLNTLTSMYAQVDNPFWDIREGAHVANFVGEEGLTKVFIDPEGNWEETRIRMSVNSLPKKVRNFIEEHYREAAVTFAGKVVRPDDVVYRVESELPTAVVVKLLSKEGILLTENRIDFGTPEPLMPQLAPLPTKITKPIAVKEFF
jgi:hypothetical protein